MLYWSPYSSKTIKKFGLRNICQRWRVVKLSQYAFEKDAILFFLYRELCNNYQEGMGQSWRGHNATRQSTKVSVILLRTENSSWMSNSNICSVLNANAYVPDSDWHLAPVYPSWQLQVYPLILSVHDPPFKQGLLEHSLMSVAKCTIWETTPFPGNI